MFSVFQLSYLDALQKSLEIVKRDANLIEDKIFFSEKDQLKRLINIYMKFDPDKLLQSMRAVEPDNEVLKNDAVFMMKIYNFTEYPNDYSISSLDKERYYELHKKYKFPVIHLKPKWQPRNFIALPSLVFCKEEHELKKEFIYPKSPDQNPLKKYKNFKIEYSTETIMSLLPKDKKYGGFVKANLHLWILNNVEPFSTKMDIIHDFENIIPFFRSLYNSKTYNNDERIEFFENLGIKEEDCAQWTQVFDVYFAGFKDVHKLFGQIA